MLRKNIFPRSKQDTIIKRTFSPALCSTVLHSWKMIVFMPLRHFCASVHPTQSKCALARCTLFWYNMQFNMHISTYIFVKRLLFPPVGNILAQTFLSYKIPCKIENNDETFTIDETFFLSPQRANCCRERRLGLPQREEIFHVAKNHYKKIWRSLMTFPFFFTAQKGTKPTKQKSPFTAKQRKCSNDHSSSKDSKVAAFK